MLRSISSVMMLAFIGIVIVAGLFGPYVISIILGALAAMCFWSLATGNSFDH